VTDLSHHAREDIEAILQNVQTQLDEWQELARRITGMDDDACQAELLYEVSDRIRVIGEPKS